MLALIKNLSKSFGPLKVLNEINLEITPGELVALIGPSGCGKSTLLRCLNGLESLDKGQITLLGTSLLNPQDIGEREFYKRAKVIRQKVGMVFQSFNLFPHMSVLENLVKPQIIIKNSSLEVAEQTAKELLNKVGLSDKANSYPHQLSGGQQQRIAIARALAMKPELMLYDEPTSSLDPTLVQEVLQVMKQLHTEGLTQIVVTHEMRFARDVADRVVFLEKGSIVEMGTPQKIFSNPEHDSTRNFLRHFQ